MANFLCVKPVLYRFYLCLVIFSMTFPTKLSDNETEKPCSAVQYWNPDIQGFCSACPRGTYVKIHCTRNNPNSTCAPCPTRTFSDKCNGATACTVCTAFCSGGKHGNIVPQIKIRGCNKLHNIVCACPGGSFISNVNPVYCEKYTPCNAGTGAVFPAPRYRDLICEACINGKTYQDKPSVSACMNCTQCPNGYDIISQCNVTSDTICAQVPPTTLTMKTKSSTPVSTEAPDSDYDIIWKSIVGLLATTAICGICGFICKIKHKIILKLKNLRFYIGREKPMLERYKSNNELMFKEDVDHYDIVAFIQNNDRIHENKKRFCKGLGFSNHDIEKILKKDDFFTEAMRIYRQRELDDSSAWLKIGKVIEEIAGKAVALNYFTRHFKPPTSTPSSEIGQGPADALMHARSTAV